MTADGTGTGTFSFEWDAEGRMMQATDNGSSTVTTFVYNALGQRVKKTVGASTLNTAFDAFGQEIGWHTGSYWAQYFVPMPGGSTPLAKYEDGTVHFLHRDALGSTRFLTNHFGTVRQDAIYYPFGQLWDWRGGLYDQRFASLGLRRGYGAGDIEGVDDHTQFRFYGSRLYRWLSPDPLAGSILNPQSLNRYAYVMNNPTNLIDPLGLLVAPQEAISAGDIGFGWGFASNWPGGESSPGFTITFGPVFVGGGWGGGGGGGGTSAGGSGNAGFPQQEGTITWPPPGTDPVTIEVILATLGGRIAACFGNPICTGVVIGATALAVGYTAYTIYQASKVKVPSIDQVRLNCTLVRVVTEPSKKYPGGTSVEEVYNCNGVEFTIHCLYTKTGIQQECHVRPGGAKGGVVKP